ncbi:MAG: DM13 domain-containing protein, partial [Candidatus Methylomirabilales bacterium]
NSDLFVWASRASRPTTSAEALAAPHVELAPLKSTIGNQNYLATGTTQEEFLSVVIWCQPVQIAYGAATLEQQ